MNRSAYDQSIAALALRNALKAAAVLGDSHSAGLHVPANWSAIAAGFELSLPMGIANDTAQTASSCAPRTPSGRTNVPIMQEFDGMSAAFATRHKGNAGPNGIGPLMMRYPLNVSRASLPDSLHRADLDFYCAQRQSGNSMYWSQFTIGHADIEDAAATDFYFAKSSSKNIFGPFRIWSEAPGGGGCPNFLTGAGIWLQSLWAGYLGVRFADDALLIRAPRLPPNTTALTLRGVAYAGARLRLRLDGGGMRICLVERARGVLKVAVDGGAGKVMAVGSCATLKTEGRVFV